MSVSLSRHDAASRFYTFMIKREELRLKKASGAPHPWTDDPILSAYKFTNVKRVHDRTTMELLKRLYEPHLGRPLREKLLNAAIARYFGTWEFAEAVGWLTDFSPRLEGRHVRELAAARMASGDRVFTGAYVITNAGRKEPKEDVVVETLVSLWHSHENVTEAISYRNRWRDAIEALRELPGFGGSGFMAKEVMLDVILMNGFGTTGPHDRNEWCPAGPGARRGINRLVGRPTNQAMHENLAVDLMLELFSERVTYWPRSFVELELHDIQFQLCEYDKYERVRLGEGRPRSRYHPPKK